MHDDLVDRQFTATAPHVVWLTDITERNAAEGKLYLCAIKDVYSGRMSATRSTPASRRRWPWRRCATRSSDATRSAS